MRNIYIKSIKFALKQKNGVSYNELLKYLNIEDQKHFKIWFLTYFYNDSNGLYTTFNYSNKNMIDQCINDFNFDDKHHLDYRAYTYYENYKNNRISFCISIFAIGLSILSLLLNNLCK